MTPLKREGQFIREKKHGYVFNLYTVDYYKLLIETKEMIANIVSFILWMDE
jgi:hypothetical protein